MRKTIFAVLLSVTGGAVVGALLPEGRAHAGTAVRLSLEERLAHCDLALEVTVAAARGLTSATGRPETEYELEVHRTFWGEDQPHRTIRVPGGVLPDGSGMLIPGLPVLQPGERAVLFLTGPGSTGTRMTVGLAQGRLRIQAGPHGEKWAVCDPLDIALLDRSSGAPVSESTSAIPYADLIAALQAGAVARSAAEAEEPVEPAGDGR